MPPGRRHRSFGLRIWAAGCLAFLVWRVAWPVVWARSLIGRRRLLGPALATTHLMLLQPAAAEASVQLAMPGNDCPDCKLDRLASSGEHGSQAEGRIRKLISANRVMVFSKTYCPYCDMAKAALAKEGAAFEVLELDRLPAEEARALQDSLGRLTGASTVPRVFVDGTCIGGGDDTVKLQKSGRLRDLIKSTA
eukprot:TRINITY_DN74750_c0_g1_i1.p1 TRINITY_DN74750_c0_g1~~TRINITY_DN74750_c0_g1_i1.p1  ORF type:complete len:193 (-),score=37.27 TRINITY_DN74750_c0_g1_i1:83-661(-)